MHDALMGHNEDSKTLPASSAEQALACLLVLITSFFCIQQNCRGVGLCSTGSFAAQEHAGASQAPQRPLGLCYAAYTQTDTS